MGQLAIKYKSQNHSVREIKTELKLVPNETKDIDGLPIQEIVLDG